MTKTREATEAALDVLLTDATEGRSRFVRPGAAVELAAGLARRPRRTARRGAPAAPPPPPPRRPRRTARRGADLGAELAHVARGRSQARPAKRDRRFAD